MFWKCFLTILFKNYINLYLNKVLYSVKLIWLFFPLWWLSFLWLLFPWHFSVAFFTWIHSYMHTHTPQTCKTTPTQPRISPQTPTPTSPTTLVYCYTIVCLNVVMPVGSRFELLYQTIWLLGPGWITSAYTQLVSSPRLVEYNL